MIANNDMLAVMSRQQDAKNWMSMKPMKTERHRRHEK
jgi:hypothetical protein